MEKLSVIKLGLLGASALVLQGCNVTSIAQDAYGSKKGDLPQFERAAFNAQKPIFLAKLDEFNSTNSLPFNKTGLIECMLEDEQIQEIGGYTQLVTISKKLANPGQESTSLSDKVNSAASAQSSKTTQTYTWQGGDLWSDKEGCMAAAKGETPTRYMVEQQYVIDTHVRIEISGDIHESNSSSSTHSVSGIEINGNQTSTTTVSSTKLGGTVHEGFMSSLAIGLNNMNDPNFIYTFADESGQVMMSDFAMTKGLYNSSESVNLPGERVKSKSYSGAILAGIHRSKDGIAHGEQTSFNKQYGDTIMCFENGVLVQTSTCEKF